MVKFVGLAGKHPRQIKPESTKVFIQFESFCGHIALFVRNQTQLQQFFFPGKSSLHEVINGHQTLLPINYQCLIAFLLVQKYLRYREADNDRLDQA